MCVKKFLAEASELEVKILGAGETDLYDLHQRLHRTLTNIQRVGGKVPAHFRRLDLELLDREVEDSFDNMPV